MSSQTATAEPQLLHLLDQLTVEEKVALVVGAGMWSTTPVERLGLGPVVLSDGPVGVRGTGDGAGGGTSAMLPAPSALAATWDLSLARRTGELFAAEAHRHGVDVVLAPQVNLQRTPVGGRHFECYSEDPHLTSEVAVALVAAAQDRGVGMCVKHYVANDSETERTRYLSRVDARTLREVYLQPFERLVEAGAWSVMGAYSGVDDGDVAAPVLEHGPLVNGVLKGEWGFDGVVVSDWVATQSVAPAVRGGLDLQMPGPDGAWGDGLLDAVRSGEVDERDLDDKVLRLLRLADRVGRLALPADDGADDGTTPATPAAPATPEWTTARSAAFLRELTARSMVVLKDDAGLVPLVGRDATGPGSPADPADPADADRAPVHPGDRPASGSPLRVALLGPAAVAPFFQGGGSSFVVPDRLSYPADALRAALPEGSEVVLRAGARALRNPPALDASRCADPVSGEPGVRLDLLAGDGSVLETRTTTGWDGWLHDVRPDADAVRLRATVRVDEPGEHELGVGTVGVHEVRVCGQVVATGRTVVNEDVVLASGHNHPVATVRAVPGGGTAELDATLQVVHAVGYGHFVRGALVHRLPGLSVQDELDAAVAAAASADAAVVMVGTTEEVESEGYDRPDLDLPGNQDELVRRVLAANPRTVVVVNAGAPVLLPWLDDAPTVLWGWLPGQEAGTALADVLTGVTEPSGRLPWTLPARYADVPVPHALPHDDPAGRVLDYTEGLDVGYRAWERRAETSPGGAGRGGTGAATLPAAPFGHGLGWTTWSYDAVSVSASASASASVAVGMAVAGIEPPIVATAIPTAVEVRVTVRNVGPRDGREVVQVYVEPPAGDAERDPRRPVRWLGGFAVVDAPAGGSATVTVRVPARAFQTWDDTAHAWRTPPGEHRLRVGRSVRDLRLTALVPAGGDPQ